MMDAFGTWGEEVFGNCFPFIICCSYSELHIFALYKRNRKMDPVLKKSLAVEQQLEKRSYGLWRKIKRATRYCQHLIGNHL
jgi:hypothetical protein